MKKEFPLLAVVALPFFYLAYIWNSLPEKVPVHWNLKGEIDRYGDKIELLLIPIALPLFTYLILWIVPKIDPKNKLNKMGGKLHTIKLLLVTFMSILALYIIYSSKHESLTNPNLLIIYIGALYLIFGNFLKTIRPNYFMGFRTPWTLESESVWRKTHKLAGVMWFAGGLVVVMASFILTYRSNLMLFLFITGLITIVPTIQSYLYFNNEQME